MRDVIAVLIATIVIVAAVNGNSNTSIMNNISRDHHMPLFQIFRYILNTSLKGGPKITYIGNLCYKFNLLSQHSTSNSLLIRSVFTYFVTKLRATRDLYPLCIWKMCVLRLILSTWHAELGLFGYFNEMSQLTYNHRWNILPWWYSLQSWQNEEQYQQMGRVGYWCDEYLMCY